MYIWRGKNRRDKRNFLLGEEEYWGAPKDAKSFAVEDEILRHEQEVFHVNYFCGKTELLMQQYLDTPDGLVEVELIQKELTATRSKESDYRHFDDFDIDQKEKMKKNVYEIFRMFSDNYSSWIDREGLAKLLQYLGIRMPEKSFDLYCRNMKLNEVHKLIEFDVFYGNLLEQVHHDARKKNGWISRFRSLVGSGKGRSEEEQDGLDNELSLPYHFQKKFETIEAKLVLVDHAVKGAERASRAEYRVAHPSSLICEICGESFGERAHLMKHLKDNALHREKLRQDIADEQRFVHVAKIFVGEMGRKLTANRLIYSRDLDTLQHRADVAVADPFRPNIRDPEGLRYKQQLKGAYVQGFDPKSGVRAMHTQNGMIRQHLAPLRNKSAVNSIIQRANPTLQSVLNDLLRCKDDFIDTVSTYDTHMDNVLLAAADSEMDLDEFIMSDTSQAPLFATVRIVFNDFADGHIWIIGEFNGWKPEPMLSDMTNHTWYVVKKLCPGRYRYRFIVGKRHVVDSIASWMEDPDSPVGCNVVMVTNNAIRHAEHFKKKAGGLQKTGLLLPAEFSNKLLKIGWGSQDDDSASHTTESRSASPNRLTTAASTAESKVSRASSQPCQEGRIMHISRTDKKELMNRLTNINLRNCALYDDGAWAFSIYVQRNSFIVTLDLSYNFISDEGMQLLGLCLTNLEALADLKLNGNGFGVDGLRSITSNLQDKQTLTSLELSNNRIGDDGMDVLCKFLHYNTHIQHVFVDSCYIGNEGMESLHHALLLNNTLLSVSLSGNVIKLFGVNRLCNALEHNACLKNLNLNHNPLGPEGAKFVGDMIAVNHTLESLQISNINMMETQSSYGAHHICTGLAQNKGLLSLNLRNNGLDLDHIVVEFAEMLRKDNNTLTQLDMSGNNIKDKRWFQKDTSITVLLGKSIPSIEDSLHRNRLLLQSRMERERSLKSGNLHGKHVKIKDRRSDIVQGKWNRRREWSRVVVAEVDKQKNRLAVSEEHDRMEAEKTFLREKVNEHMQLMQLYLDQPPCAAYLSTLCGFIVQYMHDLPRVSVKDLPDRYLHSGLDTNKGTLRSELLQLKSAASDQQVVRTASSTRSRLLSTPLQLVRSISTPVVLGVAEGVRALSPFPSAPDPGIHKIQNSTEEISAARSINLPSFLNAHISILMALFALLGSGTTPLMVNPDQLEQLFQMLALPLPREEVQRAVDECLVPKQYKIGLHKLSEFVLQHAQPYSQHGHALRYRLLADMKYNPPMKEAHHIILDTFHHAALIEFRDRYRLQPENRPLFECSYCRKRFSTAKKLAKHTAKGYNGVEHRRHRVKQVIHRSQSLFLQEVKCALNGVFFPAYYELAPAKQLPDDYFPQVMDKIGSEGRPIGVVEPNRTVRAVDVYGEYLHVLIRNELGWLRYRRGKREMLHPACKGREGFDWNKMHIQESITYYRVNDALPENIELKVRHMPLPEAEVCGYLRKNQVIECIAVIGDWIQVRYQKEDAAWIMWRTTRANSAQTNQTRLRVPVTLNRPDRKVTAEGKSRKKVVADDAHSVEQQHDDHFGDHILSFEINGKKASVNPERSKYKHITRQKIEEFNEVRYGHTFKEVNPNENDLMELLVLLPLRLQYHLITKGADPLVQLPSPSSLSEEQIFDFLMNKEGVLYEEPEGELEDWLAGEGGNRFGLSEKDGLYGIRDEEDAIDTEDEASAGEDSKPGSPQKGQRPGSRAKERLLNEIREAAASPMVGTRERRRGDVRLSEYDFSALKNNA